MKKAWEAFRTLLRLGRVKAEAEKAIAQGFNPWRALRKGATAGALELIAIVGTAAVVALLDPDFWGRVLAAAGVEPELAVAILVVLKGVLESIRNWAKHRGLVPPANDAAMDLDGDQHRPPTFSAPVQHHGGGGYPPGYLVYRTDHAEPLHPVSEHWGRTPAEARRAAEGAK